MAAATTETSYPCLLAGAVLGGGRYVVVREINRGGAAVVYEAVDREMQMAVAIKAVILDVRTRDAQVRNFLWTTTSSIIPSVFAEIVMGRSSQSNYY